MKTLEFLKNLQKELQTQDHDYQAEPRFWVVMDYKKEPCWEENAEEWILYSPNRCGECELTREAIISVIESYEMDETREIDEILKEIDFKDDDSILWWFRKEIDEFAYLVPQHEVSFIVPDTMFITKKDAKEHIEKNKHHYTSRAHTYAMSALRSPSVSKLWDILEKFDWDSVELR